MAAEPVPRKTAIITLRVDEREDREFRLAARAERISVSELIRRAVRERAERLASNPR